MISSRMRVFLSSGVRAAVVVVAALSNAVEVLVDVSAVLLDEEVELDDAAAVLTGVLPSFLAWTSASTSSPFSKNVLVDMPYDSNSCLIAATRMDLISVSKSVSDVVLNS